MSEIDKFMGKSTDKSASKAEQPAPAALPAMTAEQFKDLLAAVASVGAAKPKTEAEIKAEAESLRLMHAAPNCNLNDRVWITLSENKNIGRGGQFFGVNGASFLLKPGKKAHVPRAIVDVLDNAVEGVPILDEDGVVIEYRQTIRYPYQIHATGP